MRSTETPKNKCLACGYPFDMATATFGDRQPRADDISICRMCGHLMAFTRRLTVRALTDAEMHAVAGDKRILAIQAVCAKGIGK